MPIDMNAIISHSQYLTPLIIVRKTPSLYCSAATFQGIVLPLNDEPSIVLNGKKISKKILIVTLAPLLQGDGSTIQPDIVQWDGVNYIVNHSNENSAPVDGFYDAVFDYRP